jgi:hypothetical protein
MTCDKPEMFSLDPSVCENCGQLLADHTHKYVPYKEAMWRALIAHGGIWSYYAGHIDMWRTVKLRLHFGLSMPERELYIFNPTPGQMEILAESVANCEVDLKNSSDPVSDTVAEFCGTFTENHTQHPVISGTLNCKCGEYRREQVVIEGKSVGQLIWLTVKGGEIQ